MFPNIFNRIEIHDANQNTIAKNHISGIGTKSIARVFLAQIQARRQKDLTLYRALIGETVMSWSALNKEMVDIILSYRATSPMAGHNQIAVACRSTHVIWRRMRRNLLLFRVNNLIITIIRESHSEDMIRNAVWPLEGILDEL